MRSLLLFPFLLALSASLCASLSGCQRRVPQPQSTVGDAALGARLVDQFQCGTCHRIPDIPAADGRSGPTLAAFGRRSYIAGSIPNVPDQLARWLVDPASLKPGTTMPAMGVSELEARHMAAYLGTLR